MTLQDRSTGKTIGIGRESQGLYDLTSQSSPAVCVSTDAPLLIHSRLGHPSLSKFQKMVPRFSTLSSLACEFCQLGKHTCVSFPQRLNNWATSPFELVHTDVWGPCRTASTLGFQYFVTFIDDYSRCTWLFLMKNCAELYSIFQKFYAEILTQFNISIRVLRSDNAREYFSAPFISFMSQHGIIHQSSCAHTPQQNGVAERKNRHLFFFFDQQKNRYYRWRESSQEYTGCGQKEPTKQKTKAQYNYLLPYQVMNSTTEFVLSSLNTLAQAHKLVTKLALIFWSLVIRIVILLKQLVIFSSTIMFLFVFGGTLFLQLVI